MYGQQSHFQKNIIYKTFLSNFNEHLFFYRHQALAVKWALFTFCPRLFSHYLTAVLGHLFVCEWLNWLFYACGTSHGQTQAVSGNITRISRVTVISSGFRLSRTELIHFAGNFLFAGFFDSPSLCFRTRVKKRLFAKRPPGFPVLSK